MFWECFFKFAGLVLVAFSIAWCERPSYIEYRKSVQFKYCLKADIKAQPHCFNAIKQTDDK